MGERMSDRLTAAMAAAVLSIVACGGNKAVEINPAAKPVGTRWNAVLATPAAMAGAVQIRGTAWMQPGEGNPQETLAHVSISNAAPGGEHPWHVHIGRCGSDQGIFGPPQAYGILRVGDKGLAEGDATIPLAMPRSGQYFVNVHASKDDMGTIVACGNLAAPAR
jgi:hypothetical protein